MCELWDRCPDWTDRTAELPVAEPEGTRSSFEELYSSTRPTMVRLASFLVASRAEGEELMHDAYADLLCQWDTAVNPPALLRTLVVRRCKRSLQRRINERHRLDVIGRRDGPARTWADEPDVDAVAAIARLNPERRAVVVLRFYLDMSHAQIAEVLNCSVGTARTRLHRALAELRRIINDTDPEGLVKRER